MYGGAGTRLERNDASDLPGDSDQARDSDQIMGDNANIYRLVNGSGAFLSYAYDNYGPQKIIVRGVALLDYTLGGPDYDAAAQALDRGAGDHIRGEAGNDFIHGMAGSDILFGDAQDDDIIGGYGHDWISGGTGQDGVIGDDGLIRTSRNGTAEPLFGIAATAQTTISTPGKIQIATIDITGELKKSVDLTPISVDPDWLDRQDDEYGYGGDAQGAVPFADDIVYGGLGSDWLHGGSGDDAISGAEALPEFFDAAASALPKFFGDLPASRPGDGTTGGSTINPGNVLRFNAVDEDGWKTQNRQRAGEFALYDEYDPLRAIRVDSADGWSGDLVKDGGGYNFILNFDPTEGVLRPSETVSTNGNKSIITGPVNDDGDDKIFGGTGNDWLVGGTGKDNVYGGWGNDLMNVDDDHRTNGGLNDQPDTHSTYEDRAYGGAGRDVLIGNTGGDRLIDWVGEYNSYLVPFAPFGMATVSRTLQPQLPEFLYALSRADGADPTIFADGNGTEIRNGEPFGELGLVLQKDFAWHDQTGAPADPQAGNIPGGKRDVLRSANFNDGAAQSFVPESGSWSVVQGKYQVAPQSSGTNKDAISLFYVDQYVPNYFEVQATINAVKPTGGLKANAYIVFDYQSPTDFKFAGINVSTSKFEIGRRTAAGWQVLATGVVNGSLRADTDYNVLLSINGTAVTMVVDNQQSLSYAFAPRIDADGVAYNLNAGMIGLGADNGRARIDNVNVQIIPPAITYTVTDEFSTSPSALLTGQSGVWTVESGRLEGQPAAGAPFATAVNDIGVNVNALLKIDTVVKTAGLAGIVFDYYSDADFKWAAVSVATNQVLIGHYTAKSGWVADAAVGRALSADTDYALSVTLKGTTVSVALNNQTVLSAVYNAVAVDGAAGVFSRGGTASFDSFGVSTDDPALATTTPVALLAASEAPSQSGVEVTEDQAQSLLSAAKRQWATSLGTDEAGLALILGDVSVQIRNLADGRLAETDLASRVIALDDNAASWGWFVDQTPFRNEEFRRTDDGEAWAALGRGEAADKMDLLTVIHHEIGHLLGYTHTADDGIPELMDDTLAAGRRLGLTQGVTAGADQTDVRYFDDDHGRFIPSNGKAAREGAEDDMLIGPVLAGGVQRQELYALAEADALDVVFFEDPAKRGDSAEPGKYRRPMARINWGHSL
jgi:Ca2+-binding RTX toxin-like protein